MRLHRKTLAGVLVALAVACALAIAGCGSQAASTTTTAASSAAATTSAAATKTDVRVASLKGPTSIGIASLISKAKAGETTNNYTFTVAATADEILPSIIKGDYDIALVPANVASVLYNKTSGGVQVLDINTLGVLYVVTGDTSVNSIADLAGRTVYMTGKGTTPDYVMQYLLEKAGIADKVTLEFKSESTEVAAALNADPTAIGVLPEPYVTAVTTKNSSLSARVSLTDAWNAVSGDTGSQLVTGVTVVNTAFMKAHPDAVGSFLADQVLSVAAMTGDPAGTSQLVVDAGIVDSSAVAQKAIPNCNLVCIVGSDMKTALSGYLTVLYNRDPSSVGGKLPGDDFYVTL